MIHVPDLTDDPRDIEANGAAFDDRGWIVSRVGVLLSIYFLEGWRVEKRQALISILEEYLDAFADKVSRYQEPNARKLTRWNGNGAPDPYRKVAKGEDGSLFLHMLKFDKDQDDDPSLWRIFASGFEKSDVTRRLSGLKVHFPPSFLFADPDAFTRRVTDWSGWLGALHGSAGLGVMTQPGVELSTSEPWHFPLMQRYVGLEYDAMGSYWSATRNGGYERPRSSNWLTILGGDNLDRLGGIDRVREQLAPMLTCEAFGNGLVIRAGRLPTLGDIQKPDPLDAYRAAARLIKPIRYEDYDYGVIKVPDDRDSREETLRWLRRVD